MADNLKSAHRHQSVTFVAPVLPIMSKHVNIRAKWSGIDAASSGSVKAKDAGFENTPLGRPLLPTKHHIESQCEAGQLR